MAASPGGMCGRHAWLIRNAPEGEQAYGVLLWAVSVPQCGSCSLGKAAPSTHSLYCRARPAANPRCRCLANRQPSCSSRPAPVRFVSMTFRQCATAASGVSGMCGSAMPALQESASGSSDQTDTHNVSSALQRAGAHFAPAAAGPALGWPTAIRHLVAMPHCTLDANHSLTAHLLTSTWISGAPKFLLTSRGTNPTCTTTRSLDLCCYVCCSHQQACAGRRHAQQGCGPARQATQWRLAQVRQQSCSQSWGAGRTARN